MLFETVAVVRFDNERDKKCPFHISFVDFATARFKLLE